MKRIYPKLPDDIAAQFSNLEPSGGTCEPVYFPCAATLKSGDELSCVYICEATNWYLYWGVWPEDDSGKRSLDILQIANIAPSRFALPARFANKIYAVGECAMGYTIFTVVFKDGTTVPYGTGNAVDFVTYPEGKSASDVADVLPDVRRGRTDFMKCPEYTWCLYSN
jgi:hypothetical protein